MILTEGIMEYRKGNHSVYGLQYHIVLVTKYRRRCLDAEISDFLKQDICRLINGMEGNVLEINTDMDHIHILTELSPKRSIQDVIGVLKGCTSRNVKTRFKDNLSEYYYGDNYSFWSASYFISTTGGVNLDVIKKYIEQQGQAPRPKGRPKKA